MNIDREKDIEILKKLFGAKKIYYAGWDLENEFPEYIPSGKPWRTHKIDARPVPYFNTNIGQAFGVVEKMDEDGFEFTLMKSKTNYRAMFVNQGARKSGGGIDKNPATAICLASLAAKKAVEINNGNLHT